MSPTQATPTCDQGGYHSYNYYYPDPHGPAEAKAQYEPECGLPAVVRYRVEGMAEGHWGYRCQKHGRGYLTADGSVEIEETGTTVTGQS